MPLIELSSNYLKSGFSSWSAYNNYPEEQLDRLIAIRLDQYSMRLKYCFITFTVILIAVIAGGYFSLIYEPPVPVPKNIAILDKAITAFRIEEIPIGHTAYLRDHRDILIDEKRQMWLIAENQTSSDSRNAEFSILRVEDGFILTYIGEQKLEPFKIERPYILQSHRMAPIVEFNYTEDDFENHGKAYE